MKELWRVKKAFSVWSTDTTVECQMMNGEVLCVLDAKKAFFETQFPFNWYIILTSKGIFRTTELFKSFSEKIQ